jgi:transcriptional regulator with XRE-family HTH domain
VQQIDTTGLPIGKQLKVERTIADLSLTRVATAVGISAGYLSRIESGERIGSPELVEKIRVAIRAATGRAVA